MSNEVVIWTVSIIAMLTLLISIPVIVKSELRTRRAVAALEEIEAEIEAEIARLIAAMEREQ